MLVVGPPGTDTTALLALLSTAKNIVSMLTACDAEEAVERIAAGWCHLVVIDIERDEERGLALIRRIREGDASVRTLLLVSSVHSQTEAQLAGADVALIKGYPANDLIATVERLLF